MKPAQTSRFRETAVVLCPAGESAGHARLVLVLLLAAAHLAAQTPGAIVTHALPYSGRSVVDAAGNVYTISTTPTSSSVAIPPVTAGAYQTQPGGGTCAVGGGIISIPGPCPDAYIAKSDSSGNLAFGTFLGGSDWDSAVDLAIDSAGNVYLTGTTGLAGTFPTTPNAAIRTNAFGFAAKVSPDGSRLIYSTLLPVARPVGLAIDPQGNAYIAGYDDFQHMVVIKVNQDGSTIAYTTIIGSINSDSIQGIAVDTAGNAVVTGSTKSPDFHVTAGAFQPTLPSAQSAFVTRLDPTGNIVASTFLGGGAVDSGTSVRTDAAGNVYVAGSTTSTAFPTTEGSFESVQTVPMWSNSTGGFVTRLAPDLKSVVWSTYFPVNPFLALGGNGDVWLAGPARAGIAVTPNAPQACFTGAPNDFLMHLDAKGSLTDASYMPAGSFTVLGLQAFADGSVQLVANSSTSPNGGLSATFSTVSLTSRITFGSAGSTAAACLSPDVVNQTTFVSNGTVAPGELVTLTGFGIGPDTGVVYQLTPDGHVPTSLGGVQVYFDDIAAPILYAQSRQINLQVPWEVPGATTNVTVRYNGTTFGPYPMKTALGIPGIFRLHPGAATQAVAINEDGSLNGTDHPAAAGSVVTVYATGLGPTKPGCSTGGLNYPAATGMLYPNVIIQPAAGNGGYAAPTVEYEGSAPGLLCGIVQLNLRLPGNALPGDFPLQPQFVSTSPVWATVFVK